MLLNQGGAGGVVYHWVKKEEIFWWMDVSVCMSKTIVYSEVYYLGKLGIL